MGYPHRFPEGKVGISPIKINHQPAFLWWKLKMVQVEATKEMTTKLSLYIKNMGLNLFELFYFPSMRAFALIRLQNLSI